MVPITIGMPKGDGLVKTLFFDAEIPMGSTFDMSSDCVAFISTREIISRPYSSCDQIDTSSPFFIIKHNLDKEELESSICSSQIWFIKKREEDTCTGVIYIKLSAENNTLQEYEVAYQVIYSIREPVQFLAKLLGKKTGMGKQDEIKAVMAAVVGDAICDSMTKPIFLSANTVCDRKSPEIIHEDVLWKLFYDGFSGYGLWMRSISIWAKETIKSSTGEVDASN